MDNIKRSVCDARIIISTGGTNIWQRKENPEAERKAVPVNQRPFNVASVDE